MLTPHVVLVVYMIFKVTKRIDGVCTIICAGGLNQICVLVERGEDNCILHDQLCPNTLNVLH